MFDLAEADISHECEKIGPVEKVTLFPTSGVGAVAVKFKMAVSAEGCVDRMNGRFFAQKQLSATLYDGLTDYGPPAGKKRAGSDSDDDEEEEERLDAFGDWLEGADSDSDFS